MSKTFMTAEDVVELMRKRQGDKTNVAFASELGISNVYLGDIYNGNRTPGASVLAALGLKREVLYRSVA